MKIKLTTIFIASFIISACSGGGDGAPYVEPNDKPENIAAKKELEEFEWVKDLYASPGHMNIGVIHNEKDWSSSMIHKAACSALSRNNSDLKWVRFVDVYKISSGESPRGAQIIKVTCNS